MPRRALADGQAVFSTSGDGQQFAERDPQPWDAPGLASVDLEADADGGDLLVTVGGVTATESSDAACP